MRSLIFSAILIVVIPIICLIVAVYLYKKRRQINNSILYIIGCMVIGSYCITVFYPDIQDLISVKNNNLEMYTGECRITILEYTSRTGLTRLTDIELQTGITIWSDSLEFSHLESGVYACTASYTKKTNHLIDIILE